MSGHNHEFNYYCIQLLGMTSSNLDKLASSHDVLFNVDVINSSSMEVLFYFTSINNLVDKLVIEPKYDKYNEFNNFRIWSISTLRIKHFTFNPEPFDKLLLIDNLLTSYFDRKVTRDEMHKLILNKFNGA